MQKIVVKSGEARAKWRDLLDQVYAGKTDVVIERSGKPVAVLIPAPDYEAIRDTLVDLRADRQAASAYDEWMRDPSVVRSWKEVETELTGEGLLDE